MINGIETDSLWYRDVAKDLWVLSFIVYWIIIHADNSQQKKAKMYKKNWMSFQAVKGVVLVELAIENLDFDSSIIYSFTI